MKKRRRFGIKLLKFIFMILLFSFMYSIGVSTYENIKKNEKLEEFKSRAYESETVTKFGDTYVYHKVARVHEWEITDDRDVFYDPVTRHYPGVEGDILLTFESPFPYTPVIHQMLSFWLGGHAALVGKDNQILQSTGMTANGLLDFSTMVNVVLHRGYDETNEYGVSIQKITNYWMVPYRGVGHAEYPYYGKYYRPEIFAVRTKFRDQNTRQEHIDSAVDFIEDKVDRGLYNYLFIFDTQDKFYCTDLVTRAWAQVNTGSDSNYNLDKDGFIPSDYDILLSDDVYITIYKETITNEDGNQEIHVYYLD